MKIKLDKYSKDASTEFNKMEENLSKYEKDILNKMNGKTIDEFAAFRSFLWFVAFFILAAYVWDLVNHSLIIITMTIIGMLILFMIIDNLLELSYSKKIVPYSNAIAQMKKIISDERDLMDSKHAAFMASKEKGWDLPLNFSDTESLPEEIKNILTSTGKIESFKQSNIIIFKNIFFFAAVILITSVGCIAQFPVGNNIIKKTLENPNWFWVLNPSALCLVLVGAIMLSKLVWSKTDCNVTNITLLITLFGPAVFTLVCWLLSIIVYGVLQAIFVIIMVGLPILFSIISTRDSN